MLESGLGVRNRGSWKLDACAHAHLANPAGIIGSIHLTVSPCRGMRRLIPWRRKAEAGTAAKLNPSEPPTPASPSSTKKTFPSGIKLLHNPADPSIECVPIYLNAAT